MLRFSVVCLPMGYILPAENYWNNVNELPECVAPEDLAVTNNQTESTALKPTAVESTASISNLSQEEYSL
jgi:hypothetical protein